MAEATNRRTRRAAVGSPLSVAASPRPSSTRCSTSDTTTRSHGVTPMFPTPQCGLEAIMRCYNMTKNEHTNNPFTHTHTTHTHTHTHADMLTQTHRDSNSMNYAPLTLLWEHTHKQQMKTRKYPHCVEEIYLRDK
jgi:predicted RNA-binding Zn-ribbon protein involved in translation (DUF1610 family)